MMYPTPFATAAEVVDIAVEAEQLGYHDVAGNDHISTQRYVRESFETPPDFFEPLLTYAYVAARTTTLRLTTGILVLPLRHPVLLAKQVATLDQLSGGRVTLGVGVGAYREELEASLPQLREANRSRLVKESLECLELLFTRRRCSYHGRHHAFEDIEMYPKPVQDPLPIYSGGNAESSIRRAAGAAHGWLPAGLSPAGLAAGRERLARYAAEAGRDPEAITVAPQVMVCLAATTEEAVRRFRASQLHHHLVTLQQSTLKDVDVDAYVTNNLIGTPDDVCAKVHAFADAGADHLCGMYFAANTVEEMREQMRLFASAVMPAFAAGVR
jgi:probable F420-dependent oxidoreductase